MQGKVVSGQDAVSVIRDGDTVCVSGFVGVGTPEELLIALEERFLATGHPRDLTLVFAAAPGDGKDRGLNRLAHDGLVRRAIGGHWSLVPKLAAMAVENRIEAYNLPLGVVSQLYREIAGAKPGMLSKVGLRTFIDPRQRGGRINDRTTEDLVSLQVIDGEEWLFYRCFPIHVALLRATTADPRGNATMEREALKLDATSAAMAAHNSDGVVIVQVERIATSGSLAPKRVLIPGLWSTASSSRSRRTTARPTPPRTTTPSPASCGCRSTGWPGCRSTRARSSPGARRSSCRSAASSISASACPRASRPSPPRRRCSSTSR
jgi:propionate CoA-transferase